MKKMLSLLLASALTVSMLAGCGGGNDTPAADNADSEGEGKKIYKVCKLLNGNLGDKSFFKSDKAGLQELKAAGRIQHAKAI